MVYSGKIALDILIYVCDYWNMEKKSSAAYRANRKYEKENYYIVSVRFPADWKSDIKAHGKKSVQSFIIDCVGEKIGRKYNPIDLIARKRGEIA